PGAPELAGRPTGEALARRRLRHRRAERDDPGDDLTRPSGRGRPLRRLRRLRARAGGGPAGPLPGRRRPGPAVRRRRVRRRRLGPGAELRPRPGPRRRRDGARRPGERAGGRVRVGLRRPDGADAPLLGCGGGARPGRPRPRRGAPLPDLPAGAARRAVPRCRAPGGRDAGDRRADRVPRLRRLLDAVPGRPGPRPRLRDGAGREPADGAPGADPRRSRHPGRRLDPPDRPRPGRPGHAMAAPEPTVLTRGWASRDAWRGTRLGLWVWLVQRAAALALVVVIALHLRNPFGRAAQALLLALVLLHGLLGPPALPPHLGVPVPPPRALLPRGPG